jgi:acyl-CoA thioesterase-1
MRIFIAALAALAVLFALSAATAARPVHIVAFGDSASAGYLVARGKAYPAQLQAALRAKGYDAVMENAGVNGDTAAGALARFDRAIGPDTDVAIVEFGTNDVRRGASPATLRARMSELIRSLRARQIEVLVLGLGRLDLSATAAASGVAYAQWSLPPGRYRARDGQHFNAEGYAILVARMLPQVEALIARRTARP